MSFKINSLGSRIVRAERVSDVELMAICLMVLIILIGLSVSLIKAHFYLFAYGFIATAVPFVLALLLGLSDIYAKFRWSSIQGI